jgi:hypothetical protein
MGRRSRIAGGLALIAAVALAVAVAPGIIETKREAAEAERREEAAVEAQRIQQLRAEQRPRFGRADSAAPAGAGPERGLAARAEAMDELGAAILADARRRARAGAVEGPILRAQCEPFPRTVGGVGAERDLSRRRGRYSCVAVTAEIPGGEASVGGVIGHQYRVLIDFETGRYAYCKVSGRPEPIPDPRITTPRACGGAPAPRG